MDIENTNGTVCSECGTHDRLAEVLDDMGVEYSIAPM